MKGRSRKSTGISVSRGLPALLPSSGQVAGGSLSHHGEVFEVPTSCAELFGASAPPHG